MTLIAAYRPQGVPVLLGDFLITGGGRESSRKKIYLVGPNFVVGWTGRQFLAASILKALFKEFDGKYVSMAEVEKFLTNRPSEELLTERQIEEFKQEIPLYLIGWVIDDNSHCFGWSITWPTELFYEPFLVAGSGEGKFRELITRETLGGSWGGRRTNIDQAIYSALSKATELYSDEALERMNRRQGFGYAYELLYFDGSEFRYLDDIGFLGMDIILNPADWTGRSQPYDVWYRYHSLGDISFLQVTNLRNGDMRLETILPAFDQQPRNAAFEFTAGSFRSNYYCIYFRLQTTNGDLYQGSLVLAENKEGPSLYERQVNGATRFELSPDFMKFMYENMKAEREHSKENKIPLGWGAAEIAERITKADTKIQCPVGQNDKCVVLGLMADKEWDQNYKTMDYAIMCCADATIQIYEKGVAVGPFGKQYSTKDAFGISVEETDTRNVVRYYQNEELLYTSFIQPELPLKVVLSAYEEGASIGPCQFWHR